MPAASKDWGSLSLCHRLLSPEDLSAFLDAIGLSFKRRKTLQTSLEVYKKPSLTPQASEARATSGQLDRKVDRIKTCFAIKYPQIRLDEGRRSMMPRISPRVADGQ